MIPESRHFSIALSDACSGYAALRPPNRVSVSQGAAKNLYMKQTGAAGMLWSPDETPYMPEPMDALASRQHEAVVFVGPARTGKTAGLLLGWMSHNVVNDPGDMLFLQMTKETARTFSKTDVDRALRNSPHLHEMKSSRAVDSNTFDTMFRHGMFLRIAWPTIANVSGSTYRYVAITDIDRMENAENVDGEGPLFDLAKKRTTTFLSRGMTLVESSPGYPILDPHWQPATAHEAPPTGGILSLYNRSDRHRWYWQCLECHVFFEAKPGLGLFHLPPEEELLEEVRSANIPAFAAKFERVVCPCCGVLVDPKWKGDLNRSGIWLPDNVTITPDREIIGTPMRSSIRGYWLGGVAAAYQSWRSLVEQHLYGLREFALTGSEEKLKVTTNTDQGAPYMSQHLKSALAGAKKPEDMGNNALQRYVVPQETRCVVVSVDVQGGVTSRFVVQVHAVGPDREQWLVDRHEIKLSKRPGMGQEFAPIDPAKYAEDWDVLTEQLLRATWRTPTDGREIRLRLLVVDTGGEDGVSDNAYAWYRRVRKVGEAGRVMLYKGASERKAPIIKETSVGKRGAKGQGDVPLYICNPNLLSDIVSAGLKRQTPGPGYIHFPAPRHPTKNPDGWLVQAFFDELQAEVRAENGTWQQVRKRNESFDLCRMICAGLLRLGLDQIRDWNAVAGWLLPLDRNSEVVLREDRRAMQENTAIAQPPERQVARPVARRPRRNVAMA